MCGIPIDILVAALLGSFSSGSVSGRMVLDCYTAPYGRMFWYSSLVSDRGIPHSLWGANVGTLEVCTIDRPYLHQEILGTVTNVKWCIGVCDLFTVLAFYHEILSKIKMPFLKKRFDLRVIW